MHHLYKMTSSGEITVINVTIAPKESSHIFYNQGSPLGYVLNGANSPQLNPIRGNTYIFNIDTLGHPFYITSDQIGGDGMPGSLMLLGYSEHIGIIPNVTDHGAMTFTFPLDFPEYAYFQCGEHPNMGGIIKMQ